MLRKVYDACGSKLGIYSLTRSPGTRVIISQRQASSERQLVKLIEEASAAHRLNCYGESKFPETIYPTPLPDEVKMTIDAMRKQVPSTVSMTVNVHFATTIRFTATDQWIAGFVAPSWEVGLDAVKTFYGLQNVAPNGRLLIINIHNENNQPRCLLYTSPSPRD